MKNRFAWILPLLLGAAVASLVWWKSTLPEYVHGALSRPGESTQGAGLSPAGPELTGNRAADRTAAAPVAKPQQPDQAGRLRVQLVDATTGQPLAGVSVLAYLTDPPGGVAAASARTEAMRGSLQWSPTSDARGMVEFDLPPGQPLNLSIRPDLATHKPGTETVAPLAPYELRDLTVNVRGLRYTPYHGLVRSRADGGPVYGAGIRVLRSEVLERGAFVVDPAPPPDAGTDVQGRFQVDASEAGMVACIQAPGTGPVLIALDAVHSDAHLPREVSLAPSAWLSLRLLGERGRGLPKIPVTVRAHSVALMGQDDEPIPATMLEWKGTTNALGRVDFRNLPGDVTLAIAIDAGDGGVSRQPPQQILGPGEARELDWTVVGGTRLAGRLTGAASRQERGQELWLLPALEPGSRLLCAEDLGRVAHKVHTDSEGAFVFSGVPAGSWWVAPAPMGERSQLAPLTRRFEVPEGLTELSVEIECFPAQWIQGTVASEEGAVTTPQRLWLQPIDTGGRLTAWSDAEGHFRFGPLAPGLVELGVLAQGDGPGSQAQVAAAGDDEVRVALTQNSSLNAELASQNGSLPALRRILLTHPDGRVTEEASLAWPDLPRGNYALFVEAEDGRVAYASRLSPALGLVGGQALLTLAGGCTIELTGPGAFELWLEGACVARGELEAGSKRSLRVPSGSLRLLRPDRTVPAEMVVATPEKATAIDLGRAATGPGLAPRNPR